MSAFSQKRNSNKVIVTVGISDLRRRGGNDIQRVHLRSGRHANCAHFNPDNHKTDPHPGAQSPPEYPLRSTDLALEAAAPLLERLAKQGRGFYDR